MLLKVIEARKSTVTEVVAKKLDSMVLHLMVPPRRSTLEGLVRHWATGKSANVGDQVFENVFSVQIVALLALS
jgi:hypothetical protein